MNGLKKKHADLKFIFIHIVKCGGRKPGKSGEKIDWPFQRNRQIKFGLDGRLDYAVF